MAQVPATKGQGAVSKVGGQVFRGGKCVAIMHSFLRVRKRACFLDTFATILVMVGRADDRGSGVDGRDAQS